MKTIIAALGASLLAAISAAAQPGHVPITYRQTSGTRPYARNELVVPHEAGDADAERAELLRQGYVAHPMTWNAATKQYTIHPVVAGVPVTYRVSTVASDVMDEPFARAHGVALVADKGQFGGPTGTTGAVYHTNGPYPFTLDGHPFETASADVFDTYEYEASPRPAVLADGIAGTIGCDFMRANGAVIDFGSGTLFLKG